MAPGKAGVGGDQRPERRGPERRRHPSPGSPPRLRGGVAQDRNAMKEPAARRLAAAAAAPSRKRRPSALARGRKRRRRASARRPLALAGTAAAQTTGTPSEAAGKRCRVGLRGGRRAGTAPEAARETGRTGRPHEPESLRGPFRDAPNPGDRLSDPPVCVIAPRNLRRRIATHARPIVTFDRDPKGARWRGCQPPRHRAAVARGQRARQLTSSLVLRRAPTIYCNTPFRPLAQSIQNGCYCTFSPTRPGDRLPLGRVSGRCSFGGYEDA